MLRTLLIACVLFSSCVALAEDWPQFRGHGANGLPSEAGPLTWSETENLAWTIDVPGSGWSSPIVARGKVLLTTAVPEGDGGEEDVHRFEVHCYDLATGEALWKRVAIEEKPRIRTHRSNTYASETPVTDGERVYAYFGMTGLFCYDLEGELVWQKDLGAYPMIHDWGTASSLAISDGLLFVQIDNEEDSHAVAIDAMTGEEKWRVERPNEVSNWSSPVIWINSVRTELIVGGKTVRSHDPATGEELWSMEIGGRSSASPAAVGDVLYIGSENRSRRGGTPGGLFAVKAGAEGEIDVADDVANQPGLLWANLKAAIGIASPLVFENQLYVLERRGGLMRVHDATTGELVYKQRLPGAATFCLDDAGRTYVMAPGDDYTPLDEHEIAGQFWSTPALADGSLILRSTDRLYCVRSSSGG
jgi:outer membrane protein assembly factor BamB